MRSVLKEYYLGASPMLFLKHLAKNPIDYMALLASERLNAKSIGRIQKKQAAQLCAYALRKIPFWREAHIEYFPAKDSPNIVLADFPVISISEVTNCYPAFLSDEFDERFAQAIDGNKTFRDKRFFLRQRNLLYRALSWQTKNSTRDLQPPLKASWQELALHIVTASYKYFFRDEIGYIAHECSRKNGMHINAESFFIEILNDDLKPLPSLVSGSVIITSFDNWLTPMIRYSCGANGHIDDRPCICGRTLPRLFVKPHASI